MRVIVRFATSHRKPSREGGAQTALLLTLRQRQRRHPRDSGTQAAARWPARPIGRRQFTGYQVRDKAVWRKLPPDRSRHSRSRRSPPPSFKSWGELLVSWQRKTCRAPYPLHRRRVSLPPHRRDRSRMFAGEAASERTNRPLLPTAGSQRRHAPATALPSTSHPVRRRPGAAPGHLWEDRQLGVSISRPWTT